MPETKIVVDNEYTYITNDEVVVGDRVKVFFAEDLLVKVENPFEGIVTAIGSDYTGPCQLVKKI